MAPKPAWRIIADFPNGAQMRGYLCRGLCATADEALEHYRRYRGLPVVADNVRAERVA